MAAGKINMQKASGGVASITIVDGASNTNLVLPESGTVATQAYVDDLKIIATGTATFTATTNNINLTGVGIGVEIGDVIQISGAEDAKNNSEFTVEVITDYDNIIVNQAHSNKGASKNVATRSGDAGVTVKLLAKWYNAPLGLGQGWINPSRAFNTSYSYIPNRSMFIKVTGKATNGASNYNFEVNLNSTGYITYELNYVPVNEAPLGVDFLMPIGTTSYSINIPGATYVYWFELR